MSSPEQFDFQQNNSDNQSQRAKLLEEFNTQPKLTVERTGQNGQGQMYPPGYVPGVSDVPPQGYTGQAPQQQYNPGYPQPGYQQPNGGIQQPGQYQVPQGGDANNPYVQQQPGAPSTPADQTSSSSRGFGGGNNGGHDGLAWYLDRGLSGVSTVGSLQAFTPSLAKYIPENSTLLEKLPTSVSKMLPEGTRLPTIDSLKTPTKDEWMGAAKADLGKVMLGSWVADTLLDKSILDGRTTSWKTMVVDVATPLAATALLGKFGWMKALGISVGAHIGEKLFLEDKKQ